MKTNKIKLVRKKFGDLIPGAVFEYNGRHYRRTGAWDTRFQMQMLGGNCAVLNEQDPDGVTFLENDVDVWLDPKSTKSHITCHFNVLYSGDVFEFQDAYWIKTNSPDRLVANLDTGQLGRVKDEDIVIKYNNAELKL